MFGLEEINKTRTIKEKLDNYKTPTVIDDKYFKEWRGVRTLLSDKYFKNMLKELNVSQKQFAYSLQPMNLTDNVEHSLEGGVQWGDTFRNILNNFDYTSLDYSIGVYLPAVPFSKYLQIHLADEVEKLNNIKINEIVIDKFIESHLVEMFDIYGKVLALELEKYKRNKKSIVEDDSSIFTEFLKNKFNSKESFYELFREYPVLARIVTTRTVYFVKNITDVIRNIDSDYIEISKFLDMESLNLSNISMSHGDSHEKAKSVLILHFKEKKLVYKPKNMEINQAFESFFNWCYKNSNLIDLKVPKGIYKEKYTYSEYIDAPACKKEEDIESFYLRYGYLIAICYLLNLNDLHIENIIASGEYPVIIDIETLFQVPVNMEKDSLYIKLLRSLELESVSSSFLLPTKMNFGIDSEVDLSALSGKMVELNQKILAPVNINTSNFRYQKKTSYLPGGQNIPMVNEKTEVDYKKYILRIVEGFQQFIEFTQQNKHDFMKVLEEFKGKKIRVIIKGTEKYASLIRYSNHPNYNKEMKYRERLMMNSWAYPYKDKRVVKSEVEDLLFKDIPIFYSYPESRDLIDSRGLVYENYLEESGFQRAINRIENLSEKNVARQKSILLASLGLWDAFLNQSVTKKNMIFENQNLNFLSKAKEVADILMSQIIIEKDECAFSSIDCDKNNHWKILPLSEGLYDGMSGVALFFLQLYKKTNEDKYYSYYKIIIRSAIEQSKSSVFESAFTGWISPIYPLIVEYHNFGKMLDKNFFDVTMKKLSEMSVEQISKIEETDYISGIAGIVRLLTLAKTIDRNNQNINSSLEKFSNNLLKRMHSKKDSSMNKVGIAHGISGILLSLSTSKKIEPSHVKALLSKELELYKDRDNDYKWCWGLSGMIQSRLAILKISPESIDERELEFMMEMYYKASNSIVNDDSLCHGNGSVIMTIKIIHEYTGDFKWKKLLDRLISNVYMYSMLKGYEVPSIDDIKSKGLFDGISGVGWLYLFLDTSLIGNVMLLDT